MAMKTLQRQFDKHCRQVHPVDAFESVVVTKTEHAVISLDTTSNALEDVGALLAPQPYKTKIVSVWATSLGISQGTLGKDVNVHL